MPFHTQGHTESWEKGMPGLLSQCPGGHLGPINPVKQSTYDFFEKFFQEAATVFPDEYFHLGGDESGFYCWFVEWICIPYKKTCVPKVDMKGRNK